MIHPFLRFIEKILKTVSIDIHFSFYFLMLQIVWTNPAGKKIYYIYFTNSWKMINLVSIYFWKRERKMINFSYSCFLD